MGRPYRLLATNVILTVCSITLGCKSVKVAESSQNSTPIIERPNPLSPYTQPGLTLKPLPSPRKVVDSVELGREDPFAPIPRGPAIPPPSRQAIQEALAQIRKSQPQKPDFSWIDDFNGFSYTGVIVAGGRASVMVSYKGPYGQVSVGSIGSITAGNGSGLPPGWRVVSINDKSGLLTLMKNKRNISFYPGNVEEQIASYLEGFNP